MISNKTIIEAANRFGTPLYLYDMAHIESQYHTIRRALSAYCELFYSMKANPSIAICELLKRSGGGCEVSSANELLMAIKAGFDPCNIIFVGPGKKFSELKCAIDYGIRYLVCESMDEIISIEKIAEVYNKKVPILVRINPDFSVKNAPIKMGGVATQFGMTVDCFIENSDKIRSCHHVLLEGIQIYNASRVLDMKAISENVHHIIELSVWLSEKCDFQFKTVDLGGGFGVPYFDNEIDIEIDVLLSEINNIILHHHHEHPETRFILELGRYLVAESGYLVGCVQSVKKSHDKNYAVIDSGMHCHLGVTGMGSFVRRNFPMRHISVTEKGDSNLEDIYHITGPLCTPGDLLIKEIKLPMISISDLIVIEKTGAYGLTASPGHFLSHGSPAEVIYENDQLTLSRRRETITDLLSTTILKGEKYEHGISG